MWGLLSVSLTCESRSLQFVCIFSKDMRAAMNRFLPAPVNPFCMGINSGPWTVIHRKKCTAGPESECTRWLWAKLHTPKVEALTATEHLVNCRNAACMHARICSVCSQRALITQQKKAGNMRIFLSSSLWLKISRVIFLVVFLLWVKPFCWGVKIFDESYFTVN